MKEIKRQDRNGTRTSEELRRRYKLNEIELTADEVEVLKKLVVVDEALSTTSTHAVQNKVITQALNNKVSKETGKGLSTNDYTTEEKNKLASLTNYDDTSLSSRMTSTETNIKILGNRVTTLEESSGISLLDVYPVGSIYMSVNSTNPSNLFGGTWVAWGTGRVPVGIDTSQTEFNYSERTGGSKTHTLTINEMPSHTHGYSIASGSLDSTQYAKAGQGGTYSAVTTTSTGGNQAHNNLQPYITCYMWKRTA